MADERVGALPVDVSKIAGYGVPEDQLKNLRDALESNVKALEQRYIQPNFFKVAAGFAKPQLGGFGASFGSAMEALGENLEQQRASMLPAAQMRAQLAQADIVLGQNKVASDMLAERRAKGLPITPDFVSEVVARAPDSSVAKSLSAELTAQQKQQELTSSQQRLMLDAIQLKQAKGQPLSPAEKDFLSNLPSQLSQRPEAKPLTGGEPLAKPQPSIDAERVKGDIAALQREISRLPAGDPRLEILNAELAELKSREPKMTSEGKPSEGPKEGKFYPESFPVPNLADKPDWERTARGEAWTKNAKKEEDRNEAFVTQFSQMAMDPIFSSMDSHYNTAISMIENNPAMAKKVFNVLRGEGKIQNQIMTALQEGAGVNLGNITANINLPIQTFMTAGFSPDEQKYADRLIHSLLILGNADLAMRGITPEKGQKAYFENLLTKANLNQNPETALNILHKNKVAFDMNKKLYDTLVDERARFTNPESLTPYTDVMRHSSKIKQIQEDAQKRLDQFKSQYEYMLQQKSKGKP